MIVALYRYNCIICIKFYSIIPITDALRCPKLVSWWSKVAQGATILNILISVYATFSMILFRYKVTAN